MNILKKLSLIIILPVVTLSCSSSEGELIEPNPVYEKKYKGNLEIVLGDIKQAFGKERLATEEQIDTLVKGFKGGFKVDGVRIPIFPRGTMKQEQQVLLHYFVNKCKAEGLQLFANPMNAGGGV